ncbi:unnamed protein product [marine sediment metagenome]|uniref:Uncharacterized protein n=1 Tax=marine sediment metagenome TaxID=412755 RepID=X1U5Z7_9ZZZZ
MELTVKQAIYSLLVPLLFHKTPFEDYGTVKVLRKGLEVVFGIDITREHTSRLIREITLECGLIECEKEDRKRYNVYLPREKVFRLQSPGNILTARKWKRDGHQSSEASGKVKKKTNPA